MEVGCPPHPSSSPVSSDNPEVSGKGTALTLFVAATTTFAIPGSSCHSPFNCLQQLHAFVGSNCHPIVAERRAHVLRDGALTMVAYGADEILLWHKRVATFQQAMRCSFVGW